MKDVTQLLIYAAAGGLVIFLGSRVLAGFHQDIPPGARKVACLGDSLTASGIYAKQLKQYLPPGSITKSYGYVGKGSGYVYNKLSKVLAWEPTDIVILAGVNDLPHAGGSATVIKNLEKMYAEAHVAGVRVVAVQLTPWLCYHNTNPNGTFVVNNWIENDSTADAVVSTWNLADAEYCLLNEYDGGDGLHLNKAGQHVLAQTIADQAFDWR